MVAAFAFDQCPTGWVKADGVVYPTATYPDLFAAIGNRFGGAGANFQVPDLRGEFIRGFHDGRPGVDTLAPRRTFGSFQEASRVLIEWKRLNSAWQFSMSDFGDRSAFIEDLTTQTDTSSGIINRDANGSAAVTTGTVRPRNVALLYCIKT
jgi:hypothetical protein